MNSRAAPRPDLSSTPAAAPPPRPRPGVAQRLAMAWALVGVVLIFLDAVMQLGQRGIATVRAGLAPGEWIALALLTAAFVYGEGMRGLQRRWVPAVLRRVGQLGGERSPVYLLLAPLYAMLLIGAPPRTLRRAWTGVLAIVAAVLIVRSLPDPWRGMIDFAVAAALSWGLGAIVLGAVRLARGGSPSASASRGTGDAA